MRQIITVIRGTYLQKGLLDMNFKGVLHALALFFEDFVHFLKKYLDKVSFGSGVKKLRVRVTQCPPSIQTFLH